MNKDNLAILRDFLLSKDLPFDMSDYRTLGGNSEHMTKELLDKGVEGCGTAGCALGWAPFVLPPKPEHIMSLIHADQFVKMVGYCKDIFDLEHSGKAFNFCFAGFWQPIDNTRLGAAFRINELIHDGNTFLNFEGWDDFQIFQLEGYEKAKQDWLATVEHS